VGSPEGEEKKKKQEGKNPTKKNRRKKEAAKRRDCKRRGKEWSNRHKREDVKKGSGKGFLI